MLERKIATLIAEWLDESSNEVLLVDGARQVGKTFIIEHIIKSKCKSHVTINFQKMPVYREIFSGNRDAHTIISRISMEFPKFKIIPGSTVIFLDEIQDCPNARTAVKFLAEDGRFKVIESGSLLGLNYREVDSYPVGYEKRITLRSLDFEEFLWALGIDRGTIESVRSDIESKQGMDQYVRGKFDELFLQYMVVGGMPEAVSKFVETHDYDKVRGIQEKIIDGYRNDVSKYSKSSMKDRIFSCFDSIPFQLSRETKKFMYSEIRDDVQLKNGSRYESSIQWLMDSGIVSKCYNISEPKMPIESRIKENHFKIYLNDSGLLSYILGRDVQIAILKGDRRVNKGAILENMVAECLSKAGIVLRYFGTSSMEVDFIVVMGGNIIAMEVKSGNNKRSQSLKSVSEKYGVKRRMKFEDTDINIDDKGVEHYPLFACAFVDSMQKCRQFPKRTQFEGDENGEIRRHNGSIMRLR